MKINIMDIITSAQMFSNAQLTEDLKKRNKYTLADVSAVKHNVFNTEYANDAATYLAVGAIISYHEQLREVLLQEMNIDIGEITI